MTEELTIKPCLKCGADATIGHDVILCNACGLWIDDDHATREEAIEWWNEQPLVNRLHARIAVLEQQLAKAERHIDGLESVMLDWQGTL